MRAFFTNCNMTIKNKFLDLKETCLRNKLTLISLIVAIILSMLFSIDNQLRVKAVSTYSGNIIILIKNKNFNLFLHTLKIAFFLAIVYAFALFAKFHFSLYMCNFILIIFFIRMLFKSLYLAFIFDGIFAIFYFIFFWLPLISYALICYFLCMCKIYDVLGFEYTKSRALCCPSGKRYFSTILRCYLHTLVPILIYNIIFIIIINLIY